MSRTWDRLVLSFRQPSGSTAVEAVWPVAEAEGLTDGDSIACGLEAESAFVARAKQARTVCWAAVDRGRGKVPAAQLATGVARD